MGVITLVSELATNHGGDLTLAKQMIRASALAGADIVKVQAYQLKHLRSTDPQYAWFKQCELSDEALAELKAYAEGQRVQFLATAYHAEDFERLKVLGCLSVKIGSGEGVTLMQAAIRQRLKVYISVPWGEVRDLDERWLEVSESKPLVFATVPLYPAPLETYHRIVRRAGYSDHHVGLDVAKIAIAHGCTVIEKHFHLPGKGRNQAWNMAPKDLAELRRFADAYTQAVDGTTFQGRWTA